MNEWDKDKIVIGGNEYIIDLSIVKSLRLSRDKLDKCRRHIKWLLGSEVNRSIDGADLQDILNIIDEED